MASLDEAVIARLTRLIEKGKEVLATYRAPSVSADHYASIDRMKLSEWRAQAQSCLVSVLGEGHPYATRFVASDSKRTMGEREDTEDGIGVLQAVREDAEAGHLLATTRALVSAEVFDDLLEQAEHLLDAGYLVAATAVCGAVLESGLREIASSRGLSVKPRDDISTLNQKCVQGGVYGPLQRKEVEVLAGIRNAADHGHVEELTAERARSLDDGVRKVLAAHLGT
jgi:hypothetical protein